MYEHIDMEIDSYSTNSYTSDEANMRALEALSARSYPTPEEYQDESNKHNNEKELGRATSTLSKLEPTPVSSRDGLSTKSMPRAYDRWTEQAACKDDPELFFLEDRRGVVEAKKVCQSCQVQERCLAYALENKEPYGIWGGMTSQERNAIARRRNRGSSR